MDLNGFLKKISEPVSDENSRLLIESLFDFVKAINQMSDDDLASFYQALQIMKESQPWYFLKSNPLRVSIARVQNIVYKAMENSLKKQSRISLSETSRVRAHFKNVTGIYFD